MLEAQGDIVGEAVRIDRGGSEIQAKSCQDFLLNQPTPAFQLFELSSTGAIISTPQSPPPLFHRARFVQQSIGTAKD
jgi:hypothetical protein